MLSRLRELRFVHRIRFVCMVAACLALVGAAVPQAGSQPPPKGKVRVELRGKELGPRGAVGRFVLSGALSDRGKFVEKAGRAFGCPRTQALYGANGTIRIRVRCSQGTKRAGDTWRIIAGTKAYAGLKGRGRGGGIYGDPPPHGMHFTLTGTVWGPPIG